MRAGPIQEFNAVALPSEELQRKLLYHAQTGNDLVITPYTATGGVKAEAERQRKDREFQNFAQRVLASPQRIEQFTKKLDRLDEASAQALLENEDKLRRARDELQRIRDRAYELTKPDGTTTKVYRDGNVVRDDAGAVVDPLLMKPDDIPASFPSWDERKSKEDAVRDAARVYRETVEYRERLEQTRKKLDGSQLTESQVDEMDAEVGRMPASVKQHYERLAPDARTADKKASSLREDRTPGTFATDTRPMVPFMNAAAGQSSTAPDAAPDLDFTKIVPSVSTPGPR